MAMMQNWEPEMIRFLLDAIDSTDYYQKLAAKIAPHLPQEAHVCDAGCGLGELSRALLPYCRRVTAIDRAAAPLEELQRRITAQEAEKMEICCGDIREVPPVQPYDAMVFCLFGSAEESLKIAAEQCTGTVILIKRSTGKHAFRPGSAEETPHTARSAEELLDQLQIPYELECFSLELGQPLRSLDDGVRFYTIYGREEKEAKEAVHQRIKQGRSQKFPYYLPNHKQLILLAFSVEALRNAWKKEN
ncbi:MAG: class I SAM-dependent methyltransferase [Oscillospiraceae bacterium]|nr:class I SAM-dependent methyltransferase [Oscillospiraceae bacterium]